MSNLAQRIDALEVIDVHEHLGLGPDERTPFLFEADRMVWGGDFSILFTQYLRGDILGSGITLEQYQRMTAHDISIEHKWPIIREMLPTIRALSSYQSLIAGLRLALDLPDLDLNDDTWRVLSSSLEAALGPGYYQEVIRVTGRIQTCVVDAFAITRYKPEMGVYQEISGYAQRLGLSHIAPVLRMTDVVPASGYCPAEVLRQASVRTLGEMEDRIKRAVDEAVSLGIVCLKYPIAYVRTLDVGARPTRRDAAMWFDSLDTIGPTDVRQLQDYLIHYSLDIAEKHALPVEFHTGILAGPWGKTCHLEETNPLGLTDLVAEHPQVNFIMMHGGYPYTRDLGIMAKSMPNVFLEASWTHALSYHDLLEAMDTWFDLVPSNKIMLFGGDTMFPEETLGAVHRVKQALTQTLAKRVQSHELTIDQAIELARMVLYDNPTAIFGLDGSATQ